MRIRNHARAEKRRFREITRSKDKHTRGTHSKPTRAPALLVSLSLSTGTRFASRIGTGTSGLALRDGVRGAFWNCFFLGGADIGQPPRRGLDDSPCGGIGSWISGQISHPASGGAVAGAPRFLGVYVTKSSMKQK